MTLTVDARPSRNGAARHSDVVTSVAFSPDGRWLLSGGWDGLVKLWDAGDPARGLKLARVMRGKWDEVEAAAFSPDGRAIAGLGTGWDGAPFGAMTLWESGPSLSVRGGRRLVRAPGKVESMAWNPDGATIATAGGEARAVTIRDVGDGSVRAELLEHPGPVWSVAYAPDGRSLAAASGVVPAMVDPAVEDRRGEVCIWDLSGPRPSCRGRLVGHDYGVAAVAFSPTAPRLATGGFDRSVKLWDADSGEWLADLEGHEGWVAALAFSPAEPLLASGSHDRTIRLWDVDARICRAVLRGHAGNVYSVAFSPDGRTLASGSLDGSVRLWDVPEAD